jgi:asparagine synthase (glutamine-hydrolysing)
LLKSQHQNWGEKQPMLSIVGALVFNDSNFRISEGYLGRMLEEASDVKTWADRLGKSGLGLSGKSAKENLTNTPDSSMFCTFSGALYNKDDLLEEIDTKLAPKWRTQSDSEVVMYAFKVWGVESFKKLEGAFSFALWLEDKREVYLVRDKIGSQPLYYSTENGRLTFANTVEAILADPQHPKKMSEEGFFHYLSLLTTPAPITLYEGIKKVPNAAYTHIHPAGIIETKKYWDVLDGLQPTPHLKETDQANAVLNILENTVKKQNVAGMGTLISGDVASAAMATVSSPTAKVDKATYSLGPSEEELKSASLMADFIGSDHHERILTRQGAKEALPDLMAANTLPYNAQRSLVFNTLSQLITSPHVQCAFGADSLFGKKGWGTYLKQQNKWLYKAPVFVKSFVLKLQETLGHSTKYSYEALSRSASGQPIYWGETPGFSHAIKMHLLSDDMVKKFKDTNSFDAIKPMWLRYKNHKNKGTHPLGWLSYIDLNLHVPEGDLPAIHAHLSKAGICPHYPYLDPTFTTGILSLGEMRHKTKPKALIIKAIKGLVPKKVLKAKKNDAYTEVADLYHLEQMHQDIKDFCLKSGVMDKHAVADFIANNKGPLVWHLHSIALWWNKNINTLREVKPEVIKRAS